MMSQIQLKPKRTPTPRNGKPTSKRYIVRIDGSKPLEVTEQQFRMIQTIGNSVQHRDARESLLRSLKR